MPAFPDIIRRRPVFAFPAGMARDWYARKATEDFLNALSFSFPEVERFFIETVRHYQDRVTDPVLAAQVQDFIHQEAMHVRGHAGCNKALADSWPDGRHVESAVRRIFGVLRWLPWRSRLATTCALEHFTAMLSDDVLGMQELFTARGQPAFVQLWLWHAVEETEHKAVCFDLYQTVCGRNVFSYLLRISAMALTTLGILAFMLAAPRLLGRRGKARSGAGVTAVLNESLSMRLYWDYYRWSFHPWDHDNRGLIAEWRMRHPAFGEA